MISVDASYRDGIAGIAVYFLDRKPFTQIIQSRSSMEAEVQAMRRAMDLAREYWDDAPNQVTFRTDCDGVFKMFRKTVWNVVWIPRSKNKNANQLARQALRTYQPA